jgi:hypothetical protein
MNIEKLYKDLCRKAFHISPFRARVRFKKLKKLLASADYWQGPAGEGIAGLRIKVLKKLRFSSALVAQCLIHEIAHVVSRQSKHNNKFYAVYFTAAESKFGRRYF